MELAVVILIVGVLAGLTLASVARVRRAARATQCLAFIRTCGHAVAGYTSDHRSVFPYFANPDADGDNAFYNAGLGLSYYRQSLYYSMIMGPYFGEKSESPSLYCPSGPIYAGLYGPDRETFRESYPASFVFPSNYAMALGCFSDPLLWLPGGDSANRSLRRHTRIDEVVFPGVKGLLLEPRAYHRPGDPYGQARSISIYHEEGRAGRFSATFMDGHARQMRGDAVVPPVEVAGERAAPILTTADGLRGRDLPQ